MADLLPIESYLGELDKIKEQWAEFLQGYGIAVSADNKISGNWVDAFKSIVKGLIEGGMTKFGSSVSKVKPYLFYGDTNLTEIDLPNATEIGDYAFYNNTGLTKISIPSALIIKPYALYGNTATDLDLSSCKVLGNNNFDGATLGGGNLTIHNDVVRNIEQIGDLNFEQNAGKIFFRIESDNSIFELNAKTIGSNVFTYIQTYDTSVVWTFLLNECETIGDYSFGGSSSYRNCILNKTSYVDAPKLKKAGNDVFSYLGYYLDTDVYPTFDAPLLVEIGFKTFFATKLKELRLQNLKKAGTQSFYANDYIEVLDLPSLEELVGFETFNGCFEKLTKFRLIALRKITAESPATSNNNAFFMSAYSSYQTTAKSVLTELYLDALEELAVDGITGTGKAVLTSNLHNLEFVSLGALKEIPKYWHLETFQTGGYIKSRADCYYYAPVLESMYNVGTSTYTNENYTFFIDRFFIGGVTFTLKQLYTNQAFFTGIKKIKISGHLALDFTPVTNSSTNNPRICNEATEYLDIGGYDNTFYRGMFYNASRLTALVIRGKTIPSLYETTNTFSKCYRLVGTVNSTYNPNGIKGAIYVDDDMVDLYLAHTTWKNVTNVDIRPVSELPSEYANIDWTPRTYTE